MIEYHAHAVALEAATSALAAAPLADPATTAARTQLQADLLLAPGHALLGAFLDQLLVHAVSDGRELALLQRASDLWKRGLDIFDQLGSVRDGFERALENPSDPASLALFQTAASDVQLFSQKSFDLGAEVDRLRVDVSTLAHLPEHPRQLDQRSDAWDWANLLIGRRTDALVRELAAKAGDPATRAFAFGALTGYGANVGGSAYLGQVVGGPRRSHRFRDRLARNSVGSWLARAHPSTPAPADLARRVRFGAGRAGSLPPAVESLLTDAISATFNLSRTLPLPDFGRGYRRMLQQLRLLDGFDLPPIPNAPQGIWPAKIYGDPSNPPASLQPQDVGLSGDPGGGVSIGNNVPNTSTPNSNDDQSASKGCGIAIALLIIIDVIQAFVQCCGQWFNGHTCTFWKNMLLSKLWEKDPPDPRDRPGSTDVGTTSAGLTAMAGTDQVTEFINALHDIHKQIWENLDRAQHFLAFHGLIYPGARIDLPDYSQFTTAPEFKSWPRRPVADPPNQYHLYPGSPQERPDGNLSPFLTGANPDAFPPIAAQQVILPLWRQIVRGETDTANFDQDADRGYRHECWETGGPIANDPVDVRALAFGDQ